MGHSVLRLSCPVNITVEWAVIDLWIFMYKIYGYLLKNKNKNTVSFKIT